ncbi:MAG: FAD-dependent oxidoreductase [Oscillospiraceae bacterium]
MIDVAVIGAGTAGLTAAVYAVRAGVTVKVFEKSMYGGQLGNTSEIENFPGITKISGPDLAAQMYDWSQAHSVEVVFEEIISVDFSASGYKKIITSGGEYYAKAVIIAAGVERRKLAVSGEERLSGRGVSYCATCDGAFFKDKTVAVVGGGSSALEESEYLANICKKVYLIHRRDKFRGEKALAESVIRNPKIEIIYNAKVIAINGESSVENIDISSDHGRSSISLSAVFVSIGMEPKNGAFGGVLVDESGFIVADEDCRTNIEGVFVAGDARTKSVRQIVTAAADGAVSGKFAAEFAIREGEMQ